MKSIKLILFILLFTSCGAHNPIDIMTQWGKSKNKENVKRLIKHKLWHCSYEANRNYCSRIPAVSRYMHPYEFWNLSCFDQYRWCLSQKGVK